MIHWKAEKTEMNMTRGAAKTLSFDGIPCHSQGVEQADSVMQAAETQIGYKSRQQFSTVLNAEKKLQQ